MPNGLLIQLRSLNYMKSIFYYYWQIMLTAQLWMMMECYYIYREPKIVFICSMVGSDKLHRLLIQPI